jgi:hypothetical protein
VLQIKTLNCWHAYYAAKSKHIAYEDFQGLKGVQRAVCPLDRTYLLFRPPLEYKFV